MSITILKKGIADSLQNRGHYGLQAIGVQVGGFMDFLSAQLANYILGNTLDETLYEIHFPASHFQFDEAYCICITGGNFVPIINQQSVPMHQAIVVQKGAILQFLQPLKGRIAYLAFQPMQSIDFSKQQNIIPLSLIQQIEFQIFEKTVFNFIPGPAWCDLTVEAKHALVNSHFKTTVQSNRMGFRIQGPNLHTLVKKNYLSSAVTRGTMQLLPNGQIIILMSDHQTIGGYPNIGQIILVDLPRLAQTNPNQPIQFCLCSLQKAHEQYLSIQEKFAD